MYRYVNNCIPANHCTSSLSKFIIVSKNIVGILPTNAHRNALRKIRDAAERHKLPDLWSGPIFGGTGKKRYPFRLRDLTHPMKWRSQSLWRESFTSYQDKRKERRSVAGSTRRRGRSSHAKKEKGELVGKEDEWATSYDDKLGRSLADVRAICASTARDNTEPIDDTGWRYRSPVGCRWWTCPFYLSERYVALLRYHAFLMIARDFSLNPLILIYCEGCDD